MLFETRIPLIRSDTFVSRNLFFRVSSLTLMGVKLVFVMEGEAPKLKAETMSKRTEARYGAFKKTSATNTKTSTSRGRFKAVLKEVSYSCLVPVSVIALSRGVFMFWFYPNSLVRWYVGHTGGAMGDCCWGGWGHVRLPGLTGRCGRLYHQRWRCFFIRGPDCIQKLQYEQ